MGRPGRVSGTRELVIPGTPYIIPYRIRGERLKLVAVFHGRQDGRKNCSCSATLRYPRLKQWSVSGGLGLPAEEEEMPSAEAASAGPQQPEEGVFDCIPHADISEFDRLAMRTVGGKPDEIRIHL